MKSSHCGTVLPMSCWEVVNILPLSIFGASDVSLRKWRTEGTLHISLNAPILQVYSQILFFQLILCFLIIFLETLLISSLNILISHFLLRFRPLVAGTSESDQLDRIFRLLGTPS